MGKYYSLVKDKQKKEANLHIFGDITSTPCNENDVSDYNILKQLEELGDVDVINVKINSFGGEVGTGLAIYNILRNHKAKVVTQIEGFACSIASVIAMSGDERLMSSSSLLMIHNAWSFVQGNADELRKQAEDLDIITSASINAYLEKVNISKDKLKQLMDNETWLTPEQCLEMGFATKIVNVPNNGSANQSIKNKLIDLILQHQGEINIDDEDIETNQEGGEAMKYECSECGYVHEGELPEYFVCPECGADKEKFVEVEETETDDVEVTEEETTTEEPEKEEPVEETEEETGEEENPEKDDKDEEEVTNQKIVAFFNAISRM